MTTREYNWLDDDYEDQYYDDDPRYNKFQYRIRMILEEYTDDDRYNDPVYRKRIWSEIRERMEKLIVELYHESIEDGISELVAGLNILGIMTDMSCEGHFSRAVYTQEQDGNKVRTMEWKSPWVSFEYPPDELKLKKLQQFLDEFYEEREVKKECKIVMYKRGVAGTGHGIEIDGNSAKELVVHDDDDKSKLFDEIKSKIEKQRQEIRAFTAFLRKKFIQTGFA